MHGVRCDVCSLNKYPIIYVRMSRKLCRECFTAEKETAKSLISTLPEIEEVVAPLGYNFIAGEWFSNERKGKRYTDYIFNKMNSNVA